MTDADAGRLRLPAETGSGKGLDRADHASRRLTNTLQSMFALSRVGLHAQLALEEVALRPTIDHVVAEAQMGHPEHSIRVRVPDERISVAGDPELIDTVVRNLLTNAAKYSPGGAPCWAWRSARRRYRRA